MVVVNEHDNHDRQRLDSSLVYTGAHNVYYVKSCLSDAKCFSGSRYSFRVQELKPLLFHNWPVHGEIACFNIKLNDCDTNVSSNAAVAFLGTTVTSNDDTLALQSSAAGSAQNVGIQILDRTGEVLILDGATFSAKTDLIDGTNILPFQARYIALGQSVAGTANADATFKVQYL